jgi:hypothetical protein
VATALSHAVVELAGEAGRATVTEPTGFSDTPWVMVSCSVYVLAQMWMVALGAAALIADWMVL